MLFLKKSDDKSLLEKKEVNRPKDCFGQIEALSKDYYTPKKIFFEKNDFTLVAYAFRIQMGSFYLNIYGM